MKKQKQAPPAAPSYSAEDLERFASSVAALRKNEFDTLSEAAVFCAAAAGEFNGTPATLRGICAATALPYTSVSRIVYTLIVRELLQYESVAGDRRKKLIRANLEALK